MVKSKKSKKPLVAIGALLVLGAVGFTVAMNATQHQFNNDFPLGYFKTEVTETFTSPSDWKPCDTTPKVFTVKNKGNIPTYVRVKLNEKWLNKTTTTHEIQIEIKARLDLIKMTIDGYNADFNDKYLPILINAYKATLDDQFARNKRREAIDNDKQIEAAAASKKEQEKTAEAPARSEQIEVAANNQEQQEQTTKRTVVRLELEMTPEGWSKLKAAIKADPDIVVLKCEY